MWGESPVETLSKVIKENPPQSGHVIAVLLRVYAKLEKADQELHSLDRPDFMDTPILNDYRLKWLVQALLRQIFFID